MGPHEERHELEILHQRGRLVCPCEWDAHSLCWDKMEAYRYLELSMYFRLCKIFLKIQLGDNGFPVVKMKHLLLK